MWAFPNHTYSFTFCILHILHYYNKNSSICVCHMHNYLYECVMPPFPNSTCFFLFHVMFSMLFFLIFCNLIEVELSAVQLVKPGARWPVAGARLVS